MSRSWIEFWQGITRPAVVASWLVVSVAVAIAGPFGTFDLQGLGDRLTFWAILIAISIPMALGTQAVVARVMYSAGSTVQEVLTISLFSALFSPVVWMAIRMHVRIGTRMPLRFWQILVFVTLVSVAVSISRRLHTQPRQNPEPVLGDPVVPALLKRVAESAQGSIRQLSAKDHYVRVVTDRGEDDLLMRFSDAIAELDGLEGVRVHRSHWVARAGIVGSIRRNGQQFLILDTGVEIPVSRKYRSDVEAAGLL